LLESFSKEGDNVFDPFMGSGVVAGECLIGKRNFIGYDINPLAVLIAKVRTTPIPSTKLLQALSFIEKGYINAEAEEVDFPNIHYWFSEEAIISLSKLRKAIFSLAEEDCRDFFKVVFSETVRRVSLTDYNEFKLIRRKNDTRQDALGVFKQISLKNIGLLSEFYRNFPPQKVKLLIETRNILSEPLPIPKNSVDLVITSPPYGDSKTTVAYGQFSRLSLYWLGMEERVDKESLGSRRRKIEPGLPSETLYSVLNKIEEKDYKRAREVFSFYYDLFRSIEIIADTVKPGGYVCFVVGNRRVKKEELSTDKISADFFESLGFRHLMTIVRRISNKRMPSENSPSNIRGEKDFTMRQEYIVLLRKEALLMNL
ncbi:MAG: DNA methyltransferase, partial [bacterium]